MRYTVREISFLNCFALKTLGLISYYTTLSIYIQSKFLFHASSCLHTQAHLLPKLHKTTAAPPRLQEISRATPVPLGKPNKLPAIAWFQLSTATSCFPFAAPAHVSRQTLKGDSSPCHILSSALRKSRSHSTTLKFHGETHSVCRKYPSQTAKVPYCLFSYGTNTQEKKENQNTIRPSPPWKQIF